MYSSIYFIKENTISILFKKEIVCNTDKDKKIREAMYLDRGYILQRVKKESFDKKDFKDINLKSIIHKDTFKDRQIYKYITIKCFE